MIKIREKETATNMIFYYQLEEVCSLEQLQSLVAQLLSIPKLNTSRIQLINSLERNSEYMSSDEIDIETAKCSLSENVKIHHADSISITTTFNDVSIVIGISIEKWILSLATKKHNKNMLDLLTEQFDFTNKKKGENKMSDEVVTTPTEETKETAPTQNLNEGEKIIADKLDALQQAMQALQECFDSKIATDAHKNGLFDNMHKELTRYQNGAMDKIVDTIALDIIQLVDTTKGHLRVYEKKEPNEENYKRLLRIVKGVTEDLQDILYRQSIEAYRVEGHEVDVRRQKIIQTIPTDDQSKDNLVAVRAADGYEKDGKVLRPERIKILKYSTEATNNSDEN